MSINKANKMYDFELELSVLKCFLVCTSSVEYAFVNLSVDDFKDDSSMILYSAMCEMRDLGKITEKIDIQLLRNHIKKSGKFIDMGGNKFINSILTTDINEEYFEKYIVELKTYSKRRRIDDMLSSISMCIRNGESTDDIINKMRIELDGIERDSSSNEFISVENFIDDVAESMKNGKELVEGFYSGFSSVDKMIGKFKRGKLYFLAARPSMGKTTFALKIASSMAVNDVQVGVICLEMEKEELLEKVIGMDGDGIDSAVSKLKSKAFYISDSYNGDLMNVIAQIRKLFVERGGKMINGKVVENGLDVIFVDNLSLVSATNKTKRLDAVSLATHRLKTLSRELGIAIIVLAHINRNVENDREDKRPLLSDLRESGSIEQDADGVFMLYRHEYYYPDDVELHGIMEFISRKLRDSNPGDGTKLGTVKMYRDPETGLYTQLD